MKREAARAPLAVQPITRDVLQEKYLKDGEQDVEALLAPVPGAGRRHRCRPGSCRRWRCRPPRTSR